MAVKLIPLARVTVTTAGTRVPLTALNLSNVEAVYISVPAASAGIIYVGDSTVSATVGVEVAKGAIYTILSPKGEMIDVKSIQLDAGTNASVCNVAILQRVVG